jgi:hypothetical protein
VYISSYGKKIEALRRDLGVAGNPYCLRQEDPGKKIKNDFFWSVQKTFLPYHARLNFYVGKSILDRRFGDEASTVRRADG